MMFETNCKPNCDCADCAAVAKAMGPAIERAKLMSELTTGTQVIRAIRELANVDFQRLVEAVGHLEARGELSKAERLVDSSHFPHRAVTREEIEAGRELSASGRGASAATAIYSNPNPDQAVSVRVVEMLSELLENHQGRLDGVEKAVRKNLALIGKLAEGIRPDLAKGIAALLKGEDGEDEEESEDERRAREKREAAEKGSTVAGLLAAMGSTNVAGLLETVAGRPLSKAAAVDAAINAIGADESLTSLDRLAGFSAATCLKACIEGVAAPLAAKAKIDGLPETVRRHFQHVI